MDKAQKAKLVEDLQEKFNRSEATFIAEYAGIKAGEMNEMRKALRGASVDFRIVRNTLARRAIKGTKAETIAAHLKGSAALVFSYGDVAMAAKTLTQFAKDQPNLKIRVGTLGAKVLSLNDIKSLAELPPREVLIGKLLGILKAPKYGLVGVLSGVPRKFLYTLNAVQAKKG